MMAGSAKAKMRLEDWERERGVKKGRTSFLQRRVEEGRVGLKALTARGVRGRPMDAVEPEPARVGRTVEALSTGWGVEQREEVEEEEE
jgi:hypothetical protein